MIRDRFKLIPAVYLMLIKNDKIFLLRRANTGYQDGKYSLIAGHVDGDELATHEMAREAKEEAGVVVNPEDLEFVHVAHRLSRNQPGQERIDLFFKATTWEGEPHNAEPDKCDDASWHPLNDLPESMLPFVRRVIEDVQADKSYSEYLVEPN
ncbi:MAG: hydrolase [Candidatus Saccharibacteria bacterium]|nr:hydrolase [Candidatus Saccharibacteria bacterium]